MLTTIHGALAAVATIAATATGPLPGGAAAPTSDRPIAYVRSGAIHVAGAGTARKLADGTRPRWSPDHRRIAYLSGGLPWVMNADGSGKRRLADRPAGGPAWSPDGAWIAFAGVGCTGGPAIYRIPSTGGAPEALFPAECRGEQPPDVTAPPAATGSLAERLRFDDAIAWSPDGATIAFRGGMCESVYDACLSLGTVATGAERTVAAFGGGGVGYGGFAVIPAFRPDGAALSYTAYRDGAGPLHVVEKDLGRGTVRTVGEPQDRELVYAGPGRALLTGQHDGSSWVIAVDLRTGVRTPLRPGSQPAV